MQKLIVVSSIIIWLFKLTNKYNQYTTPGSSEREQFWDSEKKEYFFDRHRGTFEAIFDFYLHGKLYPCPHIPIQLHNETVEYFRLMSVFEAEEEDEAKLRFSKMFRKAGIKTPRSKLFMALEDPCYCTAGRIYGWADLFFIFLSIIIMILETTPRITNRPNYLNSVYPSTFKALEGLTVVFFTLDVSLRCFASPDRAGFFKFPSTWLDILTVVLNLSSTSPSKYISFNLRRSEAFCA